MMKMVLALMKLAQLVGQTYNVQELAQPVRLLDWMIPLSLTVLCETLRLELEIDGFGASVQDG